MNNIEGTLNIRRENNKGSIKYQLLFATLGKSGIQKPKYIEGRIRLESFLLEIGFTLEKAKSWLVQTDEKGNVSIPNVMLREEHLSFFEDPGPMTVTL